MKIYLLSRSLLTLVLSSTALIAATPVIQPVGPVLGRPIDISSPVQGTAAILMPGIFTERDAGTPISISMNRKFRVHLMTDSNVDPVGSFWMPASSDNQNFQLMFKGRTNDNWFTETSEKHTSSFFFAYKALVAGPTQLSFDLVQWTPVGSDAVNANGTATPVKTVIRSVTFPVTVEATATGVDNGDSPQIPAQHDALDSTQVLENDFSSSSW